MCGANKLTGKMNLVCCGISEFHRLVMVLFSAMFLYFPTQVVWTSGNGLFPKTWSLFIFAQHLDHGAKNTFWLFAIDILINNT